VVATERGGSPVPPGPSSSANLLPTEHWKCLLPSRSPASDPMFQLPARRGVGAGGSQKPLPTVSLVLCTWSSPKGLGTSIGGPHGKGEQTLCLAVDSSSFPCEFCSNCPQTISIGLPLLGTSALSFKVVWVLQI
jgi:hypothetical protein